MSRKEYFDTVEEYRQWWRAYRAKNRARLREYNQKYWVEYRHKNKERIRAYDKDYRKNNPIAKEKYLVRQKTRDAVKNGLLYKPPCCEKTDCGITKLEAHHPDYNFAFQVIWLCKTHHFDLHNELTKQKWLVNA